MAETSKNKIYYNDDENSVADVLTDMKKMAESTDKAIENSKYNDAQIKKDISDAKKEQALKDAEQDNKIIELQNEKTELEKELKEAQEDFYQASIRGQASGEYIHVEDSSNCRSIIGISGNHKQETRAGYNKLNMSNAKGGTSGGITCVINEDGSYLYKGTATTTDGGAVNIWFLGYYNSEAPTLFTLEAGTYYINDVLLFSGIKQLNKPLTKIYTFTSEVNITGVRAMSATPGQTYNEVKYPIIAKSNKELPWEQYGVMPSPDYISSIVAVGSNANELENTAKTQTIKDVTFTVNEDGTVVANGMASQQVTLVLTKVLSLQKGDYMISGCPRGGTTSTYRIDVWKSDWSSLGFEVGNGTKISLSESIENAIVGITITKGTTVENMVFKPKIEKGKVATPWSPHGQGCVKVTKCNEMLYNKDIITLQNGLWANNTSGVIQNNVSGWYIVLPINGGKKYRIAKKNAGLIGVATTVTKPENGVNLVDKFDYENSITSKEIQTSKSAKYLFIGFFAGTPTEEQKISIIEGLKVVSEDYQEQSYIMPVQKEMLEEDCFDWDNEEEVHEWGRYECTGDEEIVANTVYANTFNITASTNILAGQTCMSNVAKGVNYNTTLLTTQDNIIMTSVRQNYS